MLAQVIHLERTFGVYLLVAVFLSALVYLLIRRPLGSGLVGAVAAMIVTSVFKDRPPFHYWAYANDFIIEPFTPFLRNSAYKPVEALVSLFFHVGAPMVIMWLGARLFRRAPLTDSTS